MMDKNFYAKAGAGLTVSTGSPAPTMPQPKPAKPTEAKFELLKIEYRMQFGLGLLKAVNEWKRSKTVLTWADFVKAGGKSAFDQHQGVPQNTWKDIPGHSEVVITWSKVTETPGYKYLWVVVSPIRRRCCEVSNV